MSTETDTNHVDSPYLDDFITLHSGQWASSTKEQHENNLHAYIDWIDTTDTDVIDVDRRTIIRYFNHAQEDGKAGHTLANEYNSIRGFYKHLKDDGVIDENPAKNVNISKFESVKAVKDGSARANALRPKGGFVFLTRNEVEQLVKHAEYARGNPLRNELVIKLLFQTGVRRGELCEIKLRDIEQDANPPSIDVPTLKVAGNKRRTVYYEPSLNTDLNLWVDGGYRDALPTSDSPYLFPSKKGEQLTERTINRIVVVAAEEAGLQEEAYVDYGGGSRNKITAHCLRHSFAMECLRSDIDIKTIQSVMGHEQLSTTQRYLDAYQETTRTKMRRFGTRREE